MDPDLAYKKPVYLARLESEHDLHPDESRKPLDLLGLRMELTTLLLGDREKMQTILDLFARYLDTVSSGIVPPEQPAQDWDLDSVRTLLLQMARALEAYRQAPPSGTGTAPLA